MGTILGTDNRLINYIEATNKLTLELIELIKDNYKQGRLTLGNNGAQKFKEFETFYILTEGHLENVLLTFTYKNNPNENIYDITLEVRNNNSNTIIKMEVDDDLQSELPVQMTDELSNYMFKTWNELATGI